MQGTKFSRQLTLVMPALSVAVIAAFALAAWSFSASHQQACKSRATTLNVIHDVLVIATTPRPGQTLTPERKRDLAEFRKAVFARIDNARC